MNCLKQLRYNIKINNSFLFVLRLNYNAIFITLNYVQVCSRKFKCYNILKIMLVVKANVVSIV